MTLARLCFPNKRSSFGFGGLPAEYGLIGKMAWNLGWPGIYWLAIHTLLHEILILIINWSINSKEDAMEF